MTGQRLVEAVRRERIPEGVETEICHDCGGERTCEEAKTTGSIVERGGVLWWICRDCTRIDHERQYEVVH